MPSRVAADVVPELFKATGGTGAEGRGEEADGAGVDGGLVGRAAPALAGMLIGPFGSVI